LSRFEARLTALCYAHTDWQELIDNVREIETSLQDETTELTHRWADLRAHTEKLCHAEPSLVTLLNNEELVIDILAQCGEVTSVQSDNADIATERYTFEEYRRRVNLLFQRLDDHLKQACQELIATAHAPLEKLDQHLTA
jgi:hypothetical protein